MSAKMKAEARKKSTESASPSRGTAKIRRSSVSRRADDLPEAKENALHDAHPDLSLGHDFADLSIRRPASGAESDGRDAAESCPSSVSNPHHAIPFGDAYHTSPAIIQTKLAINRPGDQYEQEADRIAGRVSAMPGHPAVGGTSPHIQRIEGQLTGQTEKAKAPASIDQTLASPGRPLESTLQQDMEQRFGNDFSRVKVHADAIADRSAQELNAEAYTVGRDVVFAAGSYAPGTDAGRRLIAHELTHVVQQSRPEGIAAGSRSQMASVHENGMLQRSEKDPDVQATTVKEDRRYELLAAQVHDGIYRLGTDEELVYQALQELNRDEKQIETFMRVYREYIARVEDEPLDSLPQDLLIKDIEDDFSGSELEFALQLINRGTPDSDQRIEANAPTTDAEYETAARRLWDAFETFAGTDEEAAYAVLLPFGRDQNKLRPLRQAYEKVSEGEDLEARVLDEMSGSELDYAVYLLFDPKRAYEYYLKQASQELSAFIRGGQRMLGESCGPADDDAFDENYWLQEVPPDSRSTCSLMARTGQRPSQAVQALFEDLTQFPGLMKSAKAWRVDCAEWVQIHHLYAMLKMLGPYRFDLQFGGSPYWLKEHRSTGLASAAFYMRPGYDDEPRHQTEKLGAVKIEAGGPALKSPSNIGDYALDENVPPRDADLLLDEAPIGSRVMWMNVYLIQHREIRSTFKFENSIKLGSDLFGAHGFILRKTFTRAEIQEKLADEGKPPGMSTEEAVNKYIVIREIEYYSTPADRP